MSRRSSPGILLPLRAERALSGGAAVKSTKPTAPLPDRDFRIKRAFKQTQEEAFFKRLRELVNTTQSRVYFQ